MNDKALKQLLASYAEQLTELRSETKALKLMLALMAEKLAGQPQVDALKQIDALAAKALLEMRDPQRGKPGRSTRN